MQGLKPTVAVIIPTYNRAHCVGEAIQSVLDQTVPADEIIVIDDGSTDNTPEVLSAFGDRIVVITQPNAGVSAARNAGIARATSEWIAFLDSDDIWYPNRIEVLQRDVHAVQDAGVHVANIDFVGCSYRKSLFELQNQTYPRDRCVKAPNGVEIILKICSLPTSALRRQWIIAIGGFNISRAYAEDLELLMRLAFVGPWLVTSATVGEARRFADDNGALARLGKSEPSRALAANVEILQDFIQHPSLGLDQRQGVCRILSGFLFQLSCALHAAGQFESARRHLIRSARGHPDIRGWLRALAPLILGSRGYRLFLAFKSPAFNREDSAET